MSSVAYYATTQDDLDRTQACMRPCPPDAMPNMGAIPGHEFFQRRSQFRQFQMQNLLTRVYVYINESHLFVLEPTRCCSISFITLRING
jgi:predicted nucleic acid-binding Zn finger protein